MTIHIEDDVGVSTEDPQREEVVVDVLVRHEGETAVAGTVDGDRILSRQEKASSSKGGNGCFFVSR